MYLKISNEFRKVYRARRLYGPKPTTDVQVLYVQANHSGLFLEGHFSYDFLDDLIYIIFPICHFSPLARNFLYQPQ